MGVFGKKLDLKIAEFILTASISKTMAFLPWGIPRMEQAMIAMIKGCFDKYLELCYNSSVVINKYRGIVTGKNF